MRETVMVKVPVLPMYGGPSERDGRTDELLCGMWGRLTGGEENGYVRIRMGYGYEGWCRKDGLKTEEQKISGARFADRAFIRSRFADVQTEAALSSPTRVTLVQGSLVAVCGEARRDGWREVELPDGGRGYVRAGQLRPVCAGEEEPYWRSDPLRLSPEREAGLRGSLVRTAESYLGTPYRWGGKSPLGIDCSGLCSLVCWMHGIVIYRDSTVREGYAVREIPRERMRPGDLLYFPGHMAMYAGGGRYLHASFSRLGVTYGSLNRGDAEYFPELAESLRCVGSVFADADSQCPAAQ